MFFDECLWNVKKASDEINENSDVMFSENENAIDNDNHRIPEKAEIQSVLNNDGNGVFWDIKEESFLIDDSSAFDVVPVDGNTVWNKLFADMDLVSEQNTGEDSEIWNFTLKEGEVECTGQLYKEGGIEFSDLSERVSVLYPEKLTEELSDFTGMDCTLGKSEDNDEINEYLFSVDGIPIYSNGYAIGEVVYPGPSIRTNDIYTYIYIPFVLESKGENVQNSDLLSAGQIEKLCRTDLEKQMDFPEVVVFDCAEFVYYYQAQKQMLLPAWHITGTSYCLYDNGTLCPIATARLIDAQTGEVYWVED